MRITNSGLGKKTVSMFAVSAVTGVIAFLASGATAASAASITQQEVSENWAGYVASGNAFSSVSGTWTVPTVTADSSSPQGYSAVWVGLGGSSGQSQSKSLEQIGTSADYAGGQTDYYAWYELLPSAQQRLTLSIHPGDTISARVIVDGTTVTMSLSDATTGQSVSKTQQMSNPDTSSADWIVEAPAADSGGGNYEIMPLADFGKVTFTSATATAGGHTGGISDSAWSTTRINLGNAGGSTGAADGSTGAADGSTGADGTAPGLTSVGPQSFSQQASAAATTSSLSGGGFSVTWQQSVDTVQPTSGQYPGDGSYPPYGYSPYGYSPYGYSPYGGYDCPGPF